MSYPNPDKYHGSFGFAVVGGSLIISVVEAVCGGCFEVVQSILPLGLNEGEIVNKLCMYPYPTFNPLLSHINPTLRSFPMEKAIYGHYLFFQFFLGDSKS